MKRLQLGIVYEKPQYLTHTYINHYYYCLNVLSICVKMSYNTGIDF